MELESSNKCDLCEVCTLHVYDEITNSWARCEKADSSLFYSSLRTIPPRYKHSTWHDFKQDTEPRKKAYEYAVAVYNKLLQKQMPKKSLVFSGKEFTGKTFISAILLRSLILKGFTGTFVSLSVLMDLYFNDKQEYYSYTQYDVLVIQLGSEIANSSIPFVVKELYTQRLQNNKYTFFTSKFFITEFTQHYSKELQDFFSLDLFKELRMR